MPREGALTFVTDQDPFIADMKFRLDWFAQRAFELDREAEARGALPRHQHWRRAYCGFPYMTGSEYFAVRRRFIDTFLNTHDINERGEVVPRMDHADNFLLMQKFTHVLEELGVRGGIPFDTQKELNEVFDAYFASGDPMGLRALREYRKPRDSSIFVKYSRKEFLHDMCRHGRVRLCPASSYSAQIHNYAVRDSELERPYVIPTFRERLRGETEIQYRGQTLQFGTGDLVVPIVYPDFYVYCLSTSIYYRLPTDFRADAALIIHDPILFVSKLNDAFLSQYGNFTALSGPVTYYDPYTDHTKVKVPQMSKHIRYSYQREFRVAYLPKIPSMRLQPEIFIELGCMDDYAHLQEL